MANASKDENGIPTLIAALNTNGTTIVKVKANASNHGLSTSDGNTGSNHGTANAGKDQNGVSVLMAVSSSTAVVGGISYIQGVTPVEIYADSSGNLLIQST